MDTLCNKAKRPVWMLISFLLLTFVFSFNNASAQLDGAKLFKQNCATCHRMDGKKSTGPALNGVFDRVPKPAEKWLLDWIKNNDKVRKSGDKYGNQIYQEYGGAQMNIFEGVLSDDEINAILSYVKSPPSATPDGPVKTPSVDGQTTGEEDKGSNSLFVLLGIITFLFILIFVLRGVKRALKNVVNERAGLPPVPERGGIWGEAKYWMSIHKRRVALIIILLVLLLSKWAWDGMIRIGVYQDYHPEQPIAFSHQIHAGDNAINCVYCHNGAEKSKTAGIPSVNVCMNCHKGIDQGPTTGETEIAKIYAAAGWNPETQKYDKPQQPVKWIKVHNLPDFVFFSHRQHVVAGKQECQTCHGEVQKMTTVSQFAPLTMAWCIDCHRKTEVPGMKDNPYYEDLHKKLAEKYKGQPITVDKMGGIDCVRCHY